MIESYIERWDLAKERHRVSILRDGTTLEWCETTSDGCTTGRGATLKNATMPRDVLGLIRQFIGEGYELGAHEVYDPGQLLAYLAQLEKRPGGETSTPHPDHPDHAAARVIAYLNALDHERATLGGAKHFFVDGRIEERHGTDGNTHVLYRGDLRSLLADLAVAVARAHRAEAVLEANDARADRAEDERDQLRRQLDAAEAQPAEVWLCEKDGQEPDPWSTLEAAQADALTSWTDAPYTMRWRKEGDTWRLYADDTWTHSVIWRRPIRTSPTDQTHAVNPTAPPCHHPEPRRIIGGVCGDCTIIPELNAGPLAAAVAEARADIATQPAGPEPTPPAPPWLVEAGDD